NALWTAANATCASIENRRDVSRVPVTPPRSVTLRRDVVKEDPLNGTVLTVMGGTAVSDRGFKIVIGPGDGVHGCKDWMKQIFVGAKANVDQVAGSIPDDPGTNGCSFASLKTQVIKVNTDQSTTNLGQFEFAAVKRGSFDFDLKSVFVAQEIILTNSDPEAS